MVKSSKLDVQIVYGSYQALFLYAKDIFRHEELQKNFGTNYFYQLEC